LAAAPPGVLDGQNGARLRDDPKAPAHMVSEVEARHAALPAFARDRRSIPVSVKTRIGYEAPEINEWIPRLLEAQPAAIALHGRTLRQAYSGAADWDALGRAAELAHSTGIPLLGNGDVTSLADAEQRIADHGLAGALIGRASYGNPLVFRPQQADPHALLHIALEHAELYEQTFSRQKRYYFIPMRKHLSWYVRGVPSAAHLRRELMQVRSRAEATTLLSDYLESWRVRAAAQASRGMSTQHAVQATA
jgi:tRNA-dihydrouridine synthase